MSRKTRSVQQNCNKIENSVHSCVKCDELVIQLEETHKELSSSQLIKKLLYKEINDITTEMMYNRTTTISMYETGDEVDLNTKWSTIASKRLCNVSKARNFYTDQITQNINNANRY